MTESKWVDRIGMTNGIPGLHSTYDGSLHPDLFMAMCEDGLATLTPTDKNYKVYIDAEIEQDAEKLRVVGSANFSKEGEKGWVRGADVDWSTVDEPRDEPDHWFLIKPRGVHRTDKFYFEHLSEGQKQRFVQLHNEDKLKLNYPGHFYRLPFFMTRSQALDAG